MQGWESVSLGVRVIPLLENKKRRHGVLVVGFGFWLLVLWFYGVWFYGFVVLWLYGFMASGILVLWCCGFVALWLYFSISSIYPNFHFRY